jgi:uncharacterized UBP type Zn finger protein
MTNQTNTTTTSTFKLPYKVTCSKCGSVKAVRHEVLLKRLMKYKGSLEERFAANQAEYLCQSCKGQAKLAELEKQFATKED